MNTQRIASAIREIDRLTAALNWLKEYGNSLTDCTGRRFRISLEYASACVGYKEATEQLNAITQIHIEGIIKHAVEDAENTIEIHLNAIREETR